MSPMTTSPPDPGQEEPPPTGPDRQPQPVGSRFELGTDGPSRVLVGVDGSRTSMRAIAWAAGLARRSGAPLVVVHVVAPSAMAAISPQGLAAVREAHEQVADELRALVLASCADVGVAAEFVIAPGDPFAELTRVADERRVDAVVVGASEAAGHRLVGSLATHLVRVARWPVTVVP